MRLLSTCDDAFVPRSLVFTLLLAAFLGADLVRAQDCVGANPFDLGRVMDLPEACPDGTDLPNTTCRWVEVSCDGMTPLRAQLRITEPTPGVAQRGTVLLGGGAPGTGYYPNRRFLVPDLAALGFRVVDRAWEPPNGWLTPEVGLRRQSCRYATLLRWIRANVYTGGALVASGLSLGAVEIGYALTTWGLGRILDLAVPASGPGVSRLDYVCSLPPPPEWQELCFAIVPPGAVDCPVLGCYVSNLDWCYQCSSAPTPEDLRADSVVHPAAVLDYPATRVHFLFGGEDCSWAVTGGLTWADSITSEKTIEFVPGTPHLLSATSEGRDAILRAIDQGTMDLPPRTCESDPSKCPFDRMPLVPASPRDRNPRSRPSRP